jgi:3-dehydroquinate synthase
VAANKQKTPTATLIPLKTSSVSYGITIGRGLLATLYPRLQQVMGERPFRTFLVTSPKIWTLWADKVRTSFPEAQAPTVLFVPAGEKHKRLAEVERLAEQMASAGADRDALLLAFGGGVIGDITGFLAAIYMRGVPYVQLPTTLLAQVDSSVGGKTGVNLRAGKNLIGSFHHPLAVLADIDTLGTLAPEELRAGLQESIKAGIIRDPELFTYLEQNRDLVLTGHPDALAKVAAASVKVKAEVVELDEKESGLRMILNFGHTIGHAIEAATKYKQLLHGEAVAWGSIAALNLGLARHTITEEQWNCMATLIQAYGPLPRFKAKAKTLVALTAADKKTRSGRRAYVLPTGIGSAEISFDVTDEELLHATKAMLVLMKEA